MFIDGEKWNFDHFIRIILWFLQAELIINITAPLVRGQAFCVFFRGAIVLDFFWDLLTVFGHIDRWASFFLYSLWRHLVLNWMRLEQVVVFVSLKTTEIVQCLQIILAQFLSRKLGSSREDHGLASLLFLYLLQIFYWCKIRGSWRLLLVFGWESLLWLLQ